MTNFDMLMSLSKVAVMSTAEVLHTTTVSSVQGVDAVSVPSSPESVKTDQTEFIEYADGGASRTYGPPPGFKNWDQVYDARVLGLNVGAGPDSGSAEPPARSSTPEPTSAGPWVGVLSFSPTKKPGKHAKGEDEDFSDPPSYEEEPVKSKAKHPVKRGKKAKATVSKKDESDDDISEAVTFTGKCVIPMPDRTSFDQRTRRTKVHRVEPLRSPMFQFSGDITLDELHSLLAKQVNTTTAALKPETLGWKFTKPVKVSPEPLTNPTELSLFRSTLQELKKPQSTVVEFWIAPPVPIEQTVCMSSVWCSC